MSADNYGVVAQHPETGRWHILMGFASDDEFVPLVNNGQWYQTAEHAMQYADREYFEYGVSKRPWPQNWREYTTCPTCDDETLIVERGES